MNLEGGRFYLEKGPFRTEAEHWAYIEELVQELHGELVDVGAGYMDGTPEAALAEAVAKAQMAARAKSAGKCP